MTIKKAYILDTNILIEDPQSIFRFEEHDVYIPIYVLEELDKFKGEQSARGANSRESIRLIDSLRTVGELQKGIKLQNEDHPESKGYLYVYYLKDRSSYKKFEDILTEKSMDNNILLCAMEIQKDRQDTKVIFVTMDVSLRCRANAIGLQVAQYKYQSVDTNTLNNKVITVEVEPDIIDQFYKTKSFNISKEMVVEYGIEINSCVMLSDGRNSALCRYYKTPNQIHPVLNALKVSNKDKTFGLTARNKEQLFALDMLLDDEIKLVSIMGNAGSGKSILSLAAALEQVLNQGLYNRLLVSRPVVPMGRDIGFLPGSVDEKLRPYMQPIYDNLEYLLMSGQTRKKGTPPLTSEILFENKTIEIEPLVYIRGRSIPNQIMLVDEAQSLTQHEIKTIITRCGENTKIIFTGDINQIDNPYVSAESNGLSIAVKKMRDDPLVGHIMLERGERSKLVNLAIECL